MSPLIKYPDQTVVLPLRYFGSVDYYAVMAAFGTVVIDDAARFNKRDKDTHRCLIADTHGELRLTVPVSSERREKREGRRDDTEFCLDGVGKPESFSASESSKLTWWDISVSDHGEWWQDFDVSIASAYGRTPFYEFYIDRLRPFFSRDVARNGVSVAALDIALDRVVRQILGITSAVLMTSKIREKREERRDNTGLCLTPREIPYYQVRQEIQGFHPHMSILDLIFNMGPESPLILREMMG